MTNMFTPHLTCEDLLDRIRKTHIGQAHIAGTGPENKTCRECMKWHRQGVKGQHNYKPPDDDEGSTSEERAYEIYPYHCNHPIMNKAGNRIPHDAKACMFFEENPSPPPATKQVKRRKRKDDSHE